MTPTPEASVHSLIRARWSPRQFAPQPVPSSALRTLFEAARSAASCFNEQPWRFVVATREQPEAYQRILDTLVEKNRAWASSAPVLFITATRRTFARNGKPNSYAMHDVGAALATLALQAAALGLEAHAMAGFDGAAARTVLGIPDEYEVGAAVALGYPADGTAMPPRNRKPVNEFVFAGRWEQPVAF
jgi:nitroreductase